MVLWRSSCPLSAVTDKLALIRNYRFHYAVITESQLIIGSYSGHEQTSFLSLLSEVFCGMSFLVKFEGYLKITVFYEIIPCSLVQSYQVRTRRIPKRWYQTTRRHITKDSNLLPQWGPESSLVGGFYLKSRFIPDISRIKTINSRTID